MALLLQQFCCSSSFIRCFHQTSIVRNEAKAMSKILRKTTSKKKRHFIENTGFNPTTFSAGSFEGKRSPNSKRAHVLNKLFMRHITDLMATGDSSSHFIGRKIEISSVQVWPDFKGVNVYWVAKGTKEDDEISKVLDENVRALRHELTQLQVVGIVPKIIFVKDKLHAKMAEVEAALQKADFEEGHQRTDFTTDLKSELQITYKLHPETKIKIESLENSENESEEEIITLPPMPQNVLGLDHDLIMKKLLLKMSKKNDSFNSQTKSFLENTKTEIEFVSQEQQKSELKKFLLKRQILKAKILKRKQDELDLENIEDVDDEEFDEINRKLPTFEKDYIDDEEQNLR